MANHVPKQMALERLNAFLGLVDDMRLYLSSQSESPADNSNALLERAGIAIPILHTGAVQHAGLLLEATADHVQAFGRSVYEPSLTVAAWANVRSALEAAAISCWLSEPGIAGQDRVRRSLALRFDGQVEQKKMSALTQPGKVADIAARMEYLADQATKVGCNVSRDDKGKVKWVGMPMPSATEVIRDMFNRESDYRLLSAITHAHSWALTQASFAKTEVEDPQDKEYSYLEKHLNGTAVMYLVLVSAEAITVSTWYRAELMGWDLASLREILKKGLASIGLKLPKTPWL